MCNNYIPVQAQLLRDVYGVEPPAVDGGVKATVNGGVWLGKQGAAYGPLQFGRDGAG
ncbi:hypothetical protein [Cupriavidus necator]|uniref:hypothetical protein n=1 Tax=Cupriavidus necator TaxID=106590 RepID=UPI0012D34A5B|nr:hypothetical protein [Cupriavidus necator]